MKQQFPVINRSRKQAPKLSTLDRFLLDFWSLLRRSDRIANTAVTIRPLTLPKFHQYLIQSKYRVLLVETPSMPLD